MAADVLEPELVRVSPRWPPADPAARAVWREARIAMERTRDKFTPWGRVRTSPFRPLNLACRGACRVLAGLGQLERWTRASLDVRTIELELSFPQLPAAFDGYRLLQIADPHFDSLAGLADAIADAAARTDPDLVVLTGDYRAEDTGEFDRPPLQRALGLLQEALAPPDGMLAILGNHDTASMVPLFEDTFGIRVLTNESTLIRRGAAEIEVVGSDDVHRFHGAPSATFLERLPPAAGFRLTLVHSPELAGPMAERGAALYLCGHTHAGQICLPGGRPVICQLHREHALAQGPWRCGAMVGYTSAGAGVTGTLPIRLNSRSEVTLIRLRRGVPAATSKG